VGFTGDRDEAITPRQKGPELFVFVFIVFPLSEQWHRPVSTYLTREVQQPDTLRAALSRAAGKFRGVVERGYYSILVSCFKWSGALVNSKFLLSYPLMPLSSSMTMILISTLL